MPGGAPRSPLDRLQNVTVEFRKKRHIDPVKLAAAGIVIFAILLAGALTYWYLYRYTPGRVKHDRWLAGGCPITVTLQPARIQRYISSMAPFGTRLISTVPRLQSTQHGPIRVDWVHVLPYEFTLMLHGDIEVTLFVNQHPDGPHFSEVLNASGFFRDFRLVNWTPPRLQPKEEGVCLASGNLAVTEETRETILSIWPEVMLSAAPLLDNRHLLGAVCNNNNGALMLLHEAAVAAYGPWGGQDLHEALREASRWVRELQLTGELSGSNELIFDLYVIFGDDSGEPLERAAALLKDAIARHLREKFGFEFEGSEEWVNATTFEGRYFLRGFEPDLRRALGNT